MRDQGAEQGGDQRREESQEGCGRDRKPSDAGKPEAVGDQRPDQAEPGVPKPAMDRNYRRWSLHQQRRNRQQQAGGRQLPTGQCDGRDTFRELPLLGEDHAGGHGHCAAESFNHAHRVQGSAWTENHEGHAHDTHDTPSQTPSGELLVEDSHGQQGNDDGLYRIQRGRYPARKTLRRQEQQGEERGHVQTAQHEALPPPRTARQLPRQAQGDDPCRQRPHERSKQWMPGWEEVCGHDVCRPPRSGGQRRQTGPQQRTAAPMRRSVHASSISRSPVVSPTHCSHPNNELLS